MNHRMNPGERINASRVADILRLIERLPGRRDSPVPGDLEGPYDFWFGGGACLTETGSTRFALDDGTRIQIPIVPRLKITIIFPDGRWVGIEQGSTIA